MANPPIGRPLAAEINGEGMDSISRRRHPPNRALTTAQGTGSDPAPTYMDGQRRFATVMALVDTFRAPLPKVALGVDSVWVAAN
jgi:hypothetical protein